jgi:hypothetical protein
MQEISLMGSPLRLGCNGARSGMLCIFDEVLEYNKLVSENNATTG